MILWATGGEIRLADPASFDGGGSSYQPHSACPAPGDLAIPTRTIISRRPEKSGRYYNYNVIARVPLGGRSTPCQDMRRRREGQRKCNKRRSYRRQDRSASIAGRKARRDEWDCPNYQSGVSFDIGTFLTAFSRVFVLLVRAAKPLNI